MVLSVSLMQLGCVSLLHNNPSSSPVTLLPKSLFPCGISLKLKGLVFWCKSSSVCGRRRRRRVRVGSISVNASLVEAPVLWAGRLCIFYALLKAGLAGSQANPLVLGGKINSLLFFSFGNLLHFYVRQVYVFFQIWKLGTLMMNLLLLLLTWDSLNGPRQYQENHVCPINV